MASPSLQLLVDPTQEKTLPNLRNQGLSKVGLILNPKVRFILKYVGSQVFPTLTCINRAKLQPLKQHNLLEEEIKSSTPTFLTQIPYLSTNSTFK